MAPVEKVIGNQVINYAHKEALRMLYDQVESAWQTVAGLERGIAEQIAEPLGIGGEGLKRKPRWERIVLIKLENGEIAGLLTVKPVDQPEMAIDGQGNLFLLTPTGEAEKASVFNLDTSARAGGASIIGGVRLPPSIPIHAPFAEGALASTERELQWLIEREPTNMEGIILSPRGLAEELHSLWEATRPGRSKGSIGFVQIQRHMNTATAAMAMIPAVALILEKSYRCKSPLISTYIDDGGP